jgi:hypothetical protein
MKTAPAFRSVLTGLFFAVIAFLLNGCISDETAENRSSQPWNGQQTWENGLPSQINQGR